MSEAPETPRAAWRGPEAHASELGPHRLADPGAAPPGAPVGDSPDLVARQVH